MDNLTKIILALIALFAVGVVIKIVIFKKTNTRKVTQNNNIAHGDIVAGNKTTNTTKK